MFDVDDHDTLDRLLRISQSVSLDDTTHRFTDLGGKMLVYKSDPLEKWDIGSESTADCIHSLFTVTCPGVNLSNQSRMR